MKKYKLDKDDSIKVRGRTSGIVKINGYAIAQDITI